MCKTIVVSTIISGERKVYVW